MLGFGFLRRSRIRYDMFDLARSVDDAKRATKLQSLYHRGQELAWDGRQVLKDLVKKHGGVRVSPEKKAAIGRIFDVILWGELAAWKISAELADQIIELEPKMAATSQAHDEARHFYVMYDYLRELGHEPRPMARASQQLLDEVLATRSLAKKLLGMQLQVESLALTLFQAVRELQVEPVLADLLRYYEKDEARHVGLGIQYLPQLIRRMSIREGLGLFAFQLQIVGWSIASLKSLEPDLRTLGVEPRTILELGRAKQLLAFQELWDQMGIDRMPRSREVVFKGINAVVDVVFPDGPPIRGLGDVVAAMRRGWNRDLYEGTDKTTLDPSKAPTPRAAHG
jgi:hypothetical protein